MPFNVIFRKNRLVECGEGSSFLSLLFRPRHVRHADRGGTLTFHGTAVTVSDRDGTVVARSTHDRPLRMSVSVDQVIHRSRVKTEHILEPNGPAIRFEAGHRYSMLIAPANRKDRAPLLMIRSDARDKSRSARHG